MMKTSTILTPPRQHRRSDTHQMPLLTPVLSLMLATGSLVLLTPAKVSAQTMDLPPVPTYLEGGTVPPVSPTSYTNAASPSSSQQYVVYVPSTDPMLLDRLKAVEPEAFLTNYQGQSVIQVGRYNYYQNAQQQVNTLAGQGIGAAISQVAAAVPQYSQLPAPPSSTTYISSGELPPLPVAAVPQTVSSGQGVAFGQPPTPYSTPANASGEMPLPPATTPVVTGVVASAGGSAPYYVVIPTGSQDLPNVSSQVIQLGTPADRVQQRQGPFGPNVAVGPFRDRGLAERWNGYFRDAGLRSSRVVYEP